MSKLQRFLAPFFWANRRIRELGPVKRLQAFREEMENQKENRELIGVDRDGNKYYQYYSYFGLPTRREIRFKEKGNYSMKDLAYYDWLTARQPLVPTAEELKQFYEEEALRYQLAKQWDEEQAKLMNAFRERQAELQEKQRMKLLQHNLELMKRDSQATEVQKEIQGRVEGLEKPEESKEQRKFQPDEWKPRSKKVRHTE